MISKILYQIINFKNLQNVKIYTKIIKVNSLQSSVVELNEF